MGRQVYILGAARTVNASFLGGFREMSAPALGSAAIKGALGQAAVDPSAVDEVIMGNVIQAGLGQAPARQAALGASIPVETGATTVNKVCGSGMKAVALGAASIIAGDADLVIAGGMESMSRAPYLLDRARSGYRLGNAEIIDAMMKDGLVDAYQQISMGVGAEAVADHYGISRDEQDDYAIESFMRAKAAWERGAFSHEVTPCGNIAADECLDRFNQEKMRRLKPAFREDGSITAANSSAISDGAAALVLASDEFCNSGKGGKPLARVVGYATAGVEPMRFGFTPAMAIRGALEKTALDPADIDLFEINEAFAVVALGAIRELKIDPARVNVNGGAVAIGHPIGATGARLLVTLVHSLHEKNGKYGIAALCIGGGEGMAVVLERL
ncbi:MAG: thiolase family protein [Nitrospirota bacterium]|nr:thiolase family protein [Nitrospirota bacterium]